MACTTIPHIDSSAQVIGDDAATKNHAPKAFLDLPTDIRLGIYDWVFYSTTLEADRETSIPRNAPQSEQNAQPYNDRIDHEDDHDGDTADKPSGPGRAGSMFLSPTIKEKLNLVCRVLNAEILQSWHSKVTYKFPCTVAFIDVLSQWSRSKLESVRHIHIVGFPLPLYPVDEEYCYTTHFVNDALPIFPGLRLDVLTVENIWLHPDGEEMEGWCLGATYCEVMSLLASSGWKEFRYLSGTLGFLLRQMRELDEKVLNMKKERGEKSYSHRISASRPRLSGLVTSDAQGNQTEHDTVENKAEAEGWESQHPDHVGPTEKQIQVWARRGTDQYTQSGKERSECIKGLLERFTWVDLRKSAGKLVDDGTDDPGAHL